MLSRALPVAIATLCIAVLCAGDAMAATHLILPDGSGDFPTIQAGLIAAAEGDTILLGDGTFVGDDNHNLDCLGKPLLLTSQSGDPEMCIIDCTAGDGDPEIPERGFVFSNEEDHTTIIRDLTIANARATST